MSLESTPAAKRKRTEEPNEKKTSPVTRHQRIWFNDGNIVLQADTTQFRVHQSILATHSTVFQDMFAVPQPKGAGSDLVDGCPLVHMSGDTAEDWEYVFSAMYRIVVIASRYPSVPILIAMARLGKKYQFDALHLEACNALKAQYPDSLVSFDHFFSSDGDSDRDYSDFAEWLMTNMHGILRLADETEIRSVLPVTYYVALTSYYEDFTKKSITANTDISSKHLRALLDGRARLAKATIDHNYKWTHSQSDPALQIPTEKCYKSATCTLARANILSDVYYNSHFTDSALDSWKMIVGDASDKLCYQCCPAAMKLFEAGREHIWQNLPQYFLGVSWDDLKGV